MTQSQTVTWPLLGSGDYVRRTLREAQVGTQSTLDLLVAAVTLGEKTWTQLAYLLSAEWDEDNLNEALKFVGSYMKCASADGVIDVASIVTILTASDRADVIRAHSIAHDPRMTLPVSVVIRRNWDDVVRFGSDRSNNVFLSMAFRTVPIPADKAALIVHFSQALVEHNGGTRNTTDRGLYEMCLTRVGLDARAQNPQPFVALVAKGRAAIESGMKDPVSTHFSPHRVEYAPPPGRPEPAPETPAPPRTTAVVNQSPRLPPVDWEEEARIAEAARRRREAAAEEAREEARLADEASRAEAEATKAVDEDAPAVVVEEDDGQETMMLSEPEIAIYKSVRMALRILKEEKGYPCDRLSTRFLYRFVDLVLPRSSSGSEVIGRMAAKGAFTRLTPARQARPSIFAVNERRFKRGWFTRAKPNETTEADVRRVIEETYSNVHILAQDVAFVTSLVEDAREPARKDHEKSAAADAVGVSQRTLVAVEAMIGLGEYLVAEHDWPSAVHLVSDIVLAVNDRVYAFKAKGRSSPGNSMKHRGLLRPAGQIDPKQFLWELTRKPITCVKKGAPPIEPVDASQYAAIVRAAFGEKLERLDAVRSAVRAHLALPAQETVPTASPSPVDIARIEQLLKEFGEVSLRLIERMERLERALASKP